MNAPEFPAEIGKVLAQRVELTFGFSGPARPVLTAIHMEVELLQARFLECDGPVPCKAHTICENHGLHPLPGNTLHDFNDLGVEEGLTTCNGNPVAVSELLVSEDFLLNFLQGAVSFQAVPVTGPALEITIIGHLHPTAGIIGR